MKSLPTVDEVAKLTLRATCAYSLRCARRGVVPLRGFMDEDTIEAPLRMAEKVAVGPGLDPADTVAAPLAAARVASAMSGLNAPSARLAALCLTRVAEVVRMAINAATASSDSAWQRGQVFGAARSAAAVPLHGAHALGKAQQASMVRAARLDYEILLRAFGAHQNAVLGEPVDISPAWWARNGARDDADA